MHHVRHWPIDTDREKHSCRTKFIHWNLLWFSFAASSSCTVVCLCSRYCSHCVLMNSSVSPSFSSLYMRMLFDIWRLSILFYCSLAVLGCFRTDLDMESICDNWCDSGRRCLVPPSALSPGGWFICPLQGNANIIILAFDSIDVRAIGMRSIDDTSPPVGSGIHTIDFRKCGQRWRLCVVSETWSIIR